MSNEKREVSIELSDFSLIACSDPENPFTSNWIVTMSFKEVGELPESMSRDEVRNVLAIIHNAYRDGRLDECREMNRRLLRHQFKRR